MSWAQATSSGPAAARPLRGRAQRHDGHVVGVRRRQAIEQHVEQGVGVPGGGGRDVEQLREALVEVWPAQLDQPVGEQHQPVVALQPELDRAVRHARHHAERRPAGAVDEDRAVRVEQEHRQVTGVGDGEAPGGGLQLGDDRGRELLGQQVGGEVVEPAERGPALGMVPGAAYGAVELRLQGDDRLVLFTDGLVELRGPDLGERFGQLLEVAATAPREADALLDVLLGRLAPPDDDDVTVVALGPASSRPS